jgi:(p)ppGpp synthase/HD superfamily hydrolase
MQLSATYDEALVYTCGLHRDQERKGSGIPYFSHLIAVSSLVLEAGGSEDEAIAGLLHDSLEDQGNRTSYEEIARRFGDRVATIVRACSDTEVVPKPPWRVRKEAYVAHLQGVDEGVLRVSRADKLHNARSILADLLAVGPVVWDRFNQPRDQVLWYYGSLAHTFARRLPGAQTQLLTDTITAMTV